MCVSVSVQAMEKWVNENCRQTKPEWLKFTMEEMFPTVIHEAGDQRNTGATVLPTC